MAFSRIMLDHQSTPCPTKDEEGRIDDRLKELAALSVKFFGAARENYPQVKTLDTDTPSGEYDAFKLALTAASGIRVRRLLAAAQQGDMESLNEHNPYNVLLTHYADTHPLRGFIIVNHLNSLLVCIQTAYDKTRQLHTNAVSELNKICLTVGKELLTFLQSTENQTKPRHGSTLFPTSDSGGALLTRSLAQFARALSFYRDKEDHFFVVHWAEILLQALQASTRNMDMSTASEGHPDKQQETQQAIADTMAVKAYALCMSDGDNNALALKMARDAFERGPNITNLVVLFHCGVCRVSDSIHNNEIGDPLLELDNALTRLSLEVSSPSSSAEILKVFPILSDSCSTNEPDNGGPLLLGIQTMWIDKFVHLYENEESLLHHDDISFFCVVRAYLCNIELLWDKWKGCNDISSVKQSGRNLDRSLDKVLAFVLKLRDSYTGDRVQESLVEATTKKEVQESDSSVSLWGDAAIGKAVGEQADCVWIAEQLWNLALFPDVSSEVSSQLFAKAHDVSCTPA